MWGGPSSTGPPEEVNGDSQPSQPDQPVAGLNDPKIQALPPTLRDVLKELDFDGDGSLGTKDMQEVMDLVKALDLRSSGRVTSQEAREGAAIIHKMKTVFDTDKSGVVEASEVSEGLDLLHRLNEAKASGSTEMEYTHLPEKIRDVFANWDCDGSGKVSANELASAAAAWVAMQKERRWLRRALLAAVFVILLMFGGMFAMGMITAELAKDMSVSADNPELRAKGGSVVQVGSSDFVVENGTMISRAAASNARRLAGGSSRGEASGASSGAMKVGMVDSVVELEKDMYLPTHVMASLTSIELEYQSQKVSKEVEQWRLLSNVSWASYTGWVGRLDLKGGGSAAFDGKSAHFDAALRKSLEVFQGSPPAAVELGGSEWRVFGHFKDAVPTSNTTEEPEAENQTEEELNGSSNGTVEERKMPRGSLPWPGLDRHTQSVFTRNGVSVASVDAVWVNSFRRLYVKTRLVDVPGVLKVDIWDYDQGAQETMDLDGVLHTQYELREGDESTPLYCRRLTASLPWPDTLVGYQVVPTFLLAEFNYTQVSGRMLFDVEKGVAHTLVVGNTTMQYFPSQDIADWRSLMLDNLEIDPDEECAAWSGTPSEFGMLNGVLTPKMGEPPMPVEPAVDWNVSCSQALRLSADLGGLDFAIEACDLSFTLSARGQATLASGTQIKADDMQNEVSLALDLSSTPGESVDANGSEANGTAGAPAFDLGGELLLRLDIINGLRLQTVDVRVLSGGLIAGRLQDAGDQSPTENFELRGRICVGCALQLVRTAFGLRSGAWAAPVVTEQEEVVLDGIFVEAVAARRIAAATDGGSCSAGDAGQCHGMGVPATTEFWDTMREHVADTDTASTDLSHFGDGTLVEEAVEDDGVEVDVLAEEDVERHRSTGRSLQGSTDPFVNETLDERRARVKRIVDTAELALAADLRCGAVPCGCTWTTGQGCSATCLDFHSLIVDAEWVDQARLSDLDALALDVGAKAVVESYRVAGPPPISFIDYRAVLADANDFVAVSQVLSSLVLRLLDFAVWKEWTCRPGELPAHLDGLPVPTISAAAEEELRVQFVKRSLGDDSEQRQQPNAAEWSHTRADLQVDFRDGETEVELSVYDPVLVSPLPHLPGVALQWAGRDIGLIINSTHIEAVSDELSLAFRGVMNSTLDDVDDEPGAYVPDGPLPMSAIHNISWFPSGVEASFEKLVWAAAPVLHFKAVYRPQDPAPGFVQAWSTSFALVLNTTLEINWETFNISVSLPWDAEYEEMIANMPDALGPGEPLAVVIDGIDTGGHRFLSGLAGEAKDRWAPTKGLGGSATAATVFFDLDPENLEVSDVMLKDLKIPIRDGHEPFVSVDVVNVTQKDGVITAVFPGEEDPDILLVHAGAGDLVLELDPQAFGASRLQGMAQLPISDIALVNLAALFRHVACDTMGEVKIKGAAVHGTWADLTLRLSVDWSPRLFYPMLGQVTLSLDVELGAADYPKSAQLRVFDTAFKGATPQVTRANISLDGVNETAPASPTGTLCSGGPWDLHMLGPSHSESDLPFRLGYAAFARKIGDTLGDDEEVRAYLPGGIQISLDFGDKGEAGRFRLEVPQDASFTVERWNQSERTVTTVDMDAEPMVITGFSSPFRVMEWPAQVEVTGLEHTQRRLFEARAAERRLAHARRLAEVSDPRRLLSNEAKALAQLGRAAFECNGAALTIPKVANEDMFYEPFSCGDDSTVITVYLDDNPLADIAQPVIKMFLAKLGVPDVPALLLSHCIVGQDLPAAQRPAGVNADACAGEGGAGLTQMLKDLLAAPLDIAWALCTRIGLSFAKDVVRPVLFSGLVAVKLPHGIALDCVSSRSDGALEERLLLVQGAVLDILQGNVGVPTISSLSDGLCGWPDVVAKFLGPMIEKVLLQWGVFPAVAAKFRTNLTMESLPRISLQVKNLIKAALGLKGDLSVLQSLEGLAAEVSIDLYTDLLGPMMGQVLLRMNAMPEFAVKVSQNVDAASTQALVDNLTELLKGLSGGEVDLDVLRSIMSGFGVANDDEAFDGFFRPALASALTHAGVPQPTSFRMAAKLDAGLVADLKKLMQKMLQSGPDLELLKELSLKLGAALYDEVLKPILVQKLVEHGMPSEVAVRISDADSKGVAQAFPKLLPGPPDLDGLQAALSGLVPGMTADLFLLQVVQPVVAHKLEELYCVDAGLAGRVSAAITTANLAVLKSYVGELLKGKIDLTLLQGMLADLGLASSAADFALSYVAPIAACHLRQLGASEAALAALTVDASKLDGLKPIFASLASGDVDALILARVWEVIYANTPYQFKMSEELLAPLIEAVFLEIGVPNHVAARAREAAAAMPVNSTNGGALLNSILDFTSAPSMAAAQAILKELGLSSMFRTLVQGLIARRLERVGMPPAAANTVASRADENLLNRLEPHVSRLLRGQLDYKLLQDLMGVLGLSEAEFFSGVVVPLVQGLLRRYDVAEAYVAPVAVKLQPSPDVRRVVTRLLRGQVDFSWAEDLASISGLERVLIPQFVAPLTRHYALEAGLCPAVAWLIRDTVAKMGSTSQALTSLKAQLERLLAGADPMTVLVDSAALFGLTKERLVTMAVRCALEELGAGRYAPLVVVHAGAEVRVARLAKLLPQRKATAEDLRALLAQVLVPEVAANVTSLALDSALVALGVPAPGRALLLSHETKLLTSALQLRLDQAHLLEVMAASADAALKELVRPMLKAQLERACVDAEAASRISEAVTAANMRKMSKYPGKLGSMDLALFEALLQDLGLAATPADFAKGYVVPFVACHLRRQGAREVVVSAMSASAAKMEPLKEAITPMLKGEVDGATILKVWRIVLSGTAYESDEAFMREFVAPLLEFSLVKMGAPANVTWSVSQEVAARAPGKLSTADMQLLDDCVAIAKQPSLGGVTAILTNLGIRTLLVETAQGMVKEQLVLLRVSPAAAEKVASRVDETIMNRLAPKLARVMMGGANLAAVRELAGVFGLTPAEVLDGVLKPMLAGALENHGVDATVIAESGAADLATLEPLLERLLRDGVDFDWAMDLWVALGINTEMFVPGFVAPLVKTAALRARVCPAVALLAADTVAQVAASDRAAFAALKDLAGALLRGEDALRTLGASAALFGITQEVLLTSAVRCTLQELGADAEVAAVVTMPAAAQAAEEVMRFAQLVASRKATAGDLKQLLALVISDPGMVAKATNAPVNSSLAMIGVPEKVRTVKLFASYDRLLTASLQLRLDVPLLLDVAKAASVDLATEILQPSLGHLLPACVRLPSGLRPPDSGLAPTLQLLLADGPSVAVLRRVAKHFGVDLESDLLKPALQCFLTETLGLLPPSSVLPATCSDLATLEAALDPLLAGELGVDALLDVGRACGVDPSTAKSRLLGRALDRLGCPARSPAPTGDPLDLLQGLLAGEPDVQLLSQWCDLKAFVVAKLRNASLPALATQVGSASLSWNGGFGVAAGAAAARWRAAVVALAAPKVSDRVAGEAIAQILGVPVSRRLLSGQAVLDWAPPRGMDARHVGRRTTGQVAQRVAARWAAVPATAKRRPVAAGRRLSSATSGQWSKVSVCASADFRSRPSSDYVSVSWPLRVAVDADLSAGTVEAVSDLEQVTLTPVGATLAAKVRYAGGGLTVVGKASWTSSSIRGFLGDAAALVDNVQVAASADTATGAWEVQGQAVGTPEKVIGLLPPSLRAGITASDVKIPVSIKKQAGDSKHSVRVGDVESCVSLKHTLGTFKYNARAKVSKPSGSPVALHSKGSLSVSLESLPKAQMDVIVSCCPLRAYGNASLDMSVPGAETLFPGGVDVKATLEGTFEGGGGGSGFSFAATGTTAITLPKLPLQTEGTTVDLRVALERPAGGALAITAEAQAEMNFVKSSPVKKISGKVTVSKAGVELDGLVDMAASIQGVSTAVDVPAVPVKVTTIDGKMVVRVNHSLPVPLFPSEWGVGEATVNVDFDSSRDPKLLATAEVSGTLDLAKFLPGQSFLGATAVSVTASSTQGVSISGSTNVDVGGYTVSLSISGEPAGGLSLYGSMDVNAELLNFGPLESVGIDSLRLDRIWVSVSSPSKRSKTASSTQFVAGLEGKLGDAPFAGMISISKGICATGEITLGKIAKLDQFLGVSLGSEPLRVQYCQDFKQLKRMKDAASALQTSSIPSVPTGTLRRLKGMLDAVPDVKPPTDVSLSIKLSAKKNSVVYKALDFAGFKEKWLKLVVGLDTATMAATLGVDTPSVNLRMGGVIKAFEFKVSVLTSGLKRGGTPSATIQLDVTKLQLHVDGTNLDFGGYLSVKATGAIEGAVQMRDPVTMPFLGPRVGLIIPDPVNKPLEFSFSFDPKTQWIGFGMQLTAIISADRHVKVQQGPDAGRTLQDDCAKRPLCATVGLDFSTKLDCKPLPVSGVCNPTAAEIDLKVMGQLGMPMVLQAFLNRDLPQAFHNAANQLYGKLGPLHLYAKKDQAAPQETQFELRGAQQPPFGTGFAFMVRAQFSKTSGIRFASVLSSGCVGIVLNGGCNGLELDRSSIGARVWNTVYDEIKQKIPQISTNDLPSAINSPSKAGPSIDVEMGKSGLSIELRASAKFVAAVMPGLNTFLPSANIHLKMNHNNLWFDGTFRLYAIDLKATFDIDILPRPGIKRLYMIFDMRRLHNAVKGAVKAISSPIYYVLDAMGVFNIMVLHYMSVQTVGGNLVFKLSITLFGSKHEPSLTLPAADMVSALRSIMTGSIDFIKKFMNKAWAAIKNFANNLSPCSCTDTRSGRAKPTEHVRTIDRWVNCPQTRMVRKCGYSFTPCGCNPGKRRSSKTITVRSVSCRRPRCDTRRRRRWVTRPSCCCGGCSTRYVRKSVTVYVPTCTTRHCCWNIPQSYMGRCKAPWVEKRTYTTGSVAMRRRECRAVGKVGPLPIACGTHLALTKIQLPGAAGQEPNRHCNRRRT